MRFEVRATSYEEGGSVVAHRQNLNFVEAVEEVGGWGMTAQSVGEFAELVHKTAFEDGYQWEDCYIEKMDADPFTVYIGVEW